MASQLTAHYGTQYWSCAGINFDPQNPDTDQVIKGTDGTIKAETDDITFLASVNLPHGATVTGCVVYGNEGAEAETVEKLAFTSRPCRPAAACYRSAVLFWLFEIFSFAALEWIRQQRGASEYS